MIGFVVVLVYCYANGYMQCLIEKEEIQVVTILVMYI